MRLGVKTPNLNQCPPLPVNPQSFSSLLISDKMVARDFSISLVLGHWGMDLSWSDLSGIQMCSGSSKPGEWVTSNRYCSQPYWCLLPRTSALTSSTILWPLCFVLACQFFSKPFPWLYHFPWRWSFRETLESLRLQSLSFSTTEVSAAICYWYGDMEFHLLYLRIILYLLKDEVIS